MRLPTTGGSVCMVALSVHTGGLSGGGGACHAMSILAGAPGPLALRATTVYVTVPGVGELAVQTDVRLLHPVHANAVGPFVHVAVKLSGVLATGTPLLAGSEHDGRAAGS